MNLGEHMKKYKIGEVIKCLVTGIENYGAFVKIDSDYSGLIHISEITVNFVRSIDDYVTIGEEIFCKILEVNEEEKRLKLTIKNINYRTDGEEVNFLESKNGFNPLKESLPLWTKEKLDEFNIDSQ